MIETTIQFAHAPTSVRVVDASVPPIDEKAAADMQALVAAEAARQAQERAAMEQLLAGLHEVAAELCSNRQQLLQELQQVAVELAVAVAAQAIHEKIKAGDFPIESLVRAAVARLESKGPIVVRLHPEDLNLLNRRLGENRGILTQPDFRFESDPTLKRGDCRADTSELGVWSKMKVHLDEIRQRLWENLTHAEIERRKTTAGDSALRRFPDRRQTA